MQLPYTFGRYTLLKKLANGGMAEIYLARLSGAIDFSKLVAIKKILPEILKDKQFTNMLRDEASALARLQHKNVVQIHELNEEHGQLFISMEYIHGIDLSRLLRDIISGKTELPLKFVIYIISQILEGLDFIHKVRGSHNQHLHIVHRDISPPNILCSWNGEIKIADFGIAKGNHRNHATAANQLKGKYSYMSPEQASGRSIDHRTDIFAVGIILFELISKERLFDGSSDYKVIEKVRRARISFSRISNASPELKEICRKALSRNQDDRFQSAAEFLSALNESAIYLGYFMTGLDFGNYLRNLYPDDVSEPAQESPLNLLAREGSKTSVMTSVQSNKRILKRIFISLLVILLCFFLPASASKRSEPISEPKLEPIPKPEPAIKPRPVKKIERGRININARPWGLVTIPGYVLRREAPIRGLKVKAGMHLIRVEHPPSSGKMSKRVNIEEGKTVKCYASFLPTKKMICR